MLEALLTPIIEFAKIIVEAILDFFTTVFIQLFGRIATSKRPILWSIICLVVVSVVILVVWLLLK